VLARGYSITTTLANAEPLRSTENLRIGDEILSRLERGIVQSRVVSLPETIDELRN